MKKQFHIALDFEVEKLTHSIENTISGDTFATDITLITKVEQLRVINKSN